MIVYVDGSSTGGNPGKAAARIVWHDEAGDEIKITRTLGEHTNNYAELVAIRMGVEAIAKHGMTDEEHTIYSDSKVAIGWLDKLPKDAQEKHSLELIIECINALMKAHKCIGRTINVKFWSNKDNGEIPADFGNK